MHARAVILHVCSKVSCTHTSARSSGSSLVFLKALVNFWGGGLEAAIWLAYSSKYVSTVLVLPGELGCKMWQRYKSTAKMGMIHENPGSCSSMLYPVIDMQA